MRLPPPRFLVGIVKSLHANGRSTTSRYAWALAVLAVSVFAGHLVHALVPNPIFITIFPAVAIAALLCGVGPSILVAGLGGSLAIYLWLPRSPSWPGADAVAANFVVFFSMAGVIVFLGYLINELISELGTEHREAELRVGEMQHRIQNLFGLILSLGRGNVASAKSVQAFWSDFEGRLRGLSKAQTLFVKPEEGADMETLIRTILSGHECSRFRLVGPPCLVKSSTSLVLGLHELATNSVKYGALSVESGRVDIVWQAREGQIEVHWAEFGGPSVVAPDSTGFGTKVLQSLRANREYNPEGVRVTFSIIGSTVNPATRGVQDGATGPVATSDAGTIELSDELEVKRTEAGDYVARIGSHWLPGRYASPSAARFALRLPDRVLRTLWGDEAGEDTPGERSPLTERELTEARQKWISRRL
jgi:two-component sensor histidine kinase